MSDVKQNSPRPFVKRIVRTAILGAVLLPIIMVSVMLITSGAYDGAFPTREQYLSQFPDGDYELFRLRSLIKIAKEAALYGAIFGAIVAVAKWAFSKN